MSDPNDPAARTPRERAQRLFEEDRFAEAAEEFTHALELDPTNVELLQQRSLAFFYNAEFDRAFADLDRAVELAPHDPAPYLGRAERRGFLDEMAETLGDLNRALELDPKSVDAHVDLASYWVAHFNLGKFAAAANRAIRLDPKDYVAISYLAIDMQWRGRPDDAKKQFDRVREILERRLATEHRSFALLLFYAGLSWMLEDDHAMSVLDEGVRRFPKLPSFYLLRAAHHLGSNRPEAAQADLDTAKDIMDRYGMKVSGYYLDRGELYAQAGDYRQALEQLRMLLEWMPDNPEAHYKILQWMPELIAAGEEKAENFLETADRFCELVPRYPHAFLLHGWLLHRLGKDREAEFDFGQAVKYLPATYDDRCFAARYLIESDRMIMARDLLCDVLQDEPGQVYALGLRGIVWNSLGAYDRAVRDLDLALEKGGLDAYLFRERGTALLELGIYALTRSPYRRAIEDFSHAIELTPKDAELWRLRGVAWYRIARKTWFGTKTSLQRAYDDYSEAIRLDPDDAENWHYRAQVSWQRLDLDAVIDDCTEALLRRPDHVDVLRLRAQTYRRMKRTEDAARDYLEINRILSAEGR